ncbi:hypothetical protein POM88_050141 [Heracleum sosnowskyi]|uniref:Fungal lipase-type domain-containing protein n=1 Tax=Heracleum sosnowskyi TaxID=360622 RepID=A0AAD8GWY8_9APIA|nr:hypothetical protein POM88_050141 [Heracleum sosnowskyi]
MPAPITVSDVRTNITSVRKRYAPPWGFSFKYPLRSLWGGGGKRFDAIAVDDAVSVDNEEKSGGNWVLKILKFRSLRRDLERCGEIEVERGEEERNECGGDEECEVCDEEGVVDKESFGKMLRRVTLGEARLYAQISYLGSLAYSIPMIKPGNLLKRHGLRFVTSSLEKKEQALKAETDKVLAQEKENALAQEKENSSAQIEEKEKGSSAEVLPEVQEVETRSEDTVDVVEDKTDGNQIGGSTAYRIAASAASYLHSRTTSLLTLKSLKPGMSEDSPNGSRGSIGNVDMLNSVDMMNGDMASFIATTDSVTSVVAAKEEVKQAVADDLNSTSSSPCGWFICDDDQTATRFFVVQGSESLASWKANLLFEPIQFEGSDVLVHRGIYEAAKGIYEQMLPEVRDHVKNHGSHAYLRFTGHSLGGSLSVMLNLMLLIRELLKAVNGNFRNHPCLKSQGLLYAPMGEFLILQPDEKFSPHHDLLPSGSGLYVLSCPISDVAEAEKQIRSAQSLFLNSPHPLEMLRDRSSYGSEGTILRDHDMRSYLKSVRNVIRQELNQVRKGRREHRRKVRWPLVAARGSNSSITMGRPVASTNMEQSQFKFAGVLQTGPGPVLATGQTTKRTQDCLPGQEWISSSFSLLLPILRVFNPHSFLGISLPSTTKNMHTKMKDDIVDIKTEKP